MSHCQCTKNALNFRILTLYPAVLPNSLVSPCSFLVESIGFSMYTIMSSVNNDCFTSFFPIKSKLKDNQSQIAQWAFCSSQSNNFLSLFLYLQYIRLSPGIHGVLQTTSILMWLDSNGFLLKLLKFLICLGLSLTLQIWIWIKLPQ